MQFASILLLGASFIGATLAQAKIAFTTLPSAVVAGQSTTLRWAGGNPNNPVTLTLKNGPTTNLQFVATIAGNARGTSFTWTPSKSLPNGEYALEISQGLDDVNYSGMFQLSGGSTASSSSSESSSAIATGSTTIAAVLPDSSSSASTTTSLTLALSALQNSTTSAPTNATATITTPLGTGVGTGASSAGTGTALNRNTTLSKPTLSSTKSSSRSSSTSSPTSTTSGSTTSSGSGGQTSAPASAAMRVGSPIALILSVFAAVVYLG